MNAVRWKAGFYIGAVAFSLWSIYLYFYDPDVLGRITREDSIAESLTAVCYLLASGIFLFVWGRGGFRNIAVLGYALLFLLVGGEEISWGQRILGLETPETLEAINVQNETNLHNIDGIHQNVRRLALLVVLTIAILMPLTERWLSTLRTLYVRLGVPVVPLWTVPLTILAIIYMAAPRLIWQQSIFKFDEIGELYLALTFLFFAVDKFAAPSRLRKRERSDYKAYPIS